MIDNISGKVVAVAAADTGNGMAQRLVLYSAFLMQGRCGRDQRLIASLTNHSAGLALPGGNNPPSSNKEF